MNRTSIRDLSFAIFVSAVAGLFLYFLWVKLQLGLVRYFDADEFAYLHWAHNMYRGQVPVMDFLMYAPPGFLYVLAPLYSFFSGTTALFAGRVFAWLVYAGICTALGVIFLELRKGEFREPAGRRIWVFFLPGLILSALPVPADKLLEIRPDNLAIFLAVLGMVAQIRALRQSGENQGLALGAWVWAGVWYGASLLVLPKTLPQVAVAVVIAAWWAMSAAGVERKRRGAGFLRMIAGFGIPGGMFLLWMGLVSGGMAGIDRILYSLVRLPFEVNRIAERFYMQPDLFFYPNAIYYGAPGWSSALIFTHAVWLTGMMAGIVRLLTPYIAGGKKGMWAEMLMAGSLIAHMAAFLYGYPLRHAQYLIPVAVFVAWYAADALVFAGKRIAWVPRYGQILFVIFCLSAGIVLYTMFTQTHIAKTALTNRDDSAFLTAVLTSVPRDAYVLDLVGATIYYRDPYYVSAVPFGQWEAYLSRPLPSLSDALEQTGTRYIYGGKLQRQETLSEADRAYIAAHFRPGTGALKDMLVRIR